MSRSLSNSTILQDYLFAVERKLVQCPTEELECLHQDIQHQIAAQKQSARKKVTKSLIDTREMADLRSKFKMAFYSKCSNPEQFHRKSAFLAFKRQLKQPPRRIRTRSTKHSQLVDNDLQCAAQLRKQIELAREQISNLQLLVSKHNHRNYQEEIENLQLENRQIKMLLCKAKQDSKFIRGYLQDLLTRNM